MPRRYTLNQRAAYVEEFHRSGLTQEAFAEEHGLSVHTLRGWIYKGIQRGDVHGELPDVRFLEVVPPADPVPFAKPVPAVGSVVLRVGDQLDLELPELPPARWLADLVQALGC